MMWANGAWSVYAIYGRSESAIDNGSDMFNKRSIVSAVDQKILPNNIWIAELFGMVDVAL